MIVSSVWFSCCISSKWGHYISIHTSEFRMNKIITLICCNLYKAMICYTQFFFYLPDTLKCIITKYQYGMRISNTSLSYLVSESEKKSNVKKHWCISCCIWFYTVRGTVRKENHLILNKCNVYLKLLCWVVLIQYLLRTGTQYRWVPKLKY